MRKVTLFYPLMMMAMFLLSACMPTPESPTVVNKSDDYILLAEEEPSEPLQVPEHIKRDSLFLNNAVITVDADITYQSSTLPILHVSAKTLDSVMLRDLCNYLNPGVVLYSSWAASKSEIETELKAWMQYAGNQGTLVDDSYVPARIEELKTALVSASDDPAREAYDFPKANGSILDEVYGLSESNTVSIFSMRNGVNEFRYAREKDLSIYASSTLEDEDPPVDEPLLSQADANEIVEAFIQEFDGQDFFISNIEKAAVLRYGERLENSWQFTLVREINGIPSITADNVRLSPQSLPSVGAPWAVETLQITVDSKGIVSLAWHGATTISSSLVDNATLLNFDEMISRAEEQLKVQNAYRENNEKKYIVNITHIELKYALLSETDSISTGRYVPVWEVTYTSLWEGATLSNTWKIYFNAVDGSYVEPRITNTELMSFANESNPN